jgi:hypothetical protein
VTWTGTDDELRASGWSDDEVTGYRAGVASVESWLAALESRPAPEEPDPAPAPSEMELRAQQLAAMMVRESDRLDAAKADLRLAEAVSQTHVVVTRPGDPPSVAEVRANALAHILRDGLVIARPGPHNRPRQMAMRDVDGEIRTFTAGELPKMVIITPSNVDRLERAWEDANRLREDQLLIAAWGLDECQRAGVLVTGARDAGEFVKLQPMRGEPR